MVNVVQQPVGQSTEATANFQRTIVRGVRLDEVRALDGDLQARVQRTYGGGAFQVWGIAKAGTDRNVKVWEKIAPGDLVTFSRSEAIVAVGTVVFTARDPDLAAQLWPTPGHEYLYFLKDVRECRIPISEFNEAVGYSPNRPQNVRVMRPDASAAAVNFLFTQLPRESDYTPGPVDVRHASRSELYRRARAAAAATSTTRTTTATYRERSDAVKAYALAWAGGACQGCGHDAPFITTTGQPYLEVHHVDKLADGGPDDPDAVIAICANCHRRVHYGRDGISFNQKLKETIAQHLRESSYVVGI